MQDPIIVLLEDVVARLESDTLRLVDEANELRDNYLSWWNPKRELKLVLKKESDSHRKAQTGQLRPVVRMRKNVSKWYLEWTTEGCFKTKKINSAWAKSIPPTKTKGYTKGLLEKNSDRWEIDKAWALEEKWKVVRSALNSIHKNKVEILKQIRSLKEDKKNEPT